MSSQRKVLSKNIKKLIDSKKIDQRVLADHLELSEMAVSSWVSGNKYPRMGNIQKMADYFGVLKSDIIEDGESRPLHTSSEYPYIPHSISAGLPSGIEAITQADIISIPDALMGKWAGNNDIYIANINGDSMNRIMPHDSLIAVKPIELHELKENDIVVYRKDAEYAVKRYIKVDDRLIFKPDSTNNTFTDDVIFLDDAERLTIQGKVVMWTVTTD